MILAFFRKAQHLSLDIVFGAVILLRFFSQELSVSPSWAAYFLLAASIWLIYTVDHLRDARKAVQSSRARYQFHLRHEKILKRIILLITVISSILAVYVNQAILFGGIVLVALSGVYLLIHQFLSSIGLKELYVAMVYTIGILLVPFIIAETVRWDMMMLLFLLTYANLIIFSWFEKEEDKADNFNSIATQLNDSRLEVVIFCILSLGLALSFQMNLSRVSVYFFSGFAIYAVICINRKWSRVDLRYRAIGDGVFLIPILFEWI